jgi:hypothetical protein
MEMRRHRCCNGITLLNQPGGPGIECFVLLLSTPCQLVYHSVMVFVSKEGVSKQNVVALELNCLGGLAEHLVNSSGGDCPQAFGQLR